MKTRQLFQAGVALAALIGLCAPLTANAQMVQEVIIGQQAPATATTPGVKVDAGTQLFFHVVNPTNGVATFSIPDVGVSQPVPALSDRTFFLDMSNVMQPSITYSVTGPSGERLAYGTIVNEDYLTGADAQMVALGDIINYSTAYSAPIMPEPNYERPASYQPSGAPVRGYW